MSFLEKSFFKKYLLPGFVFQSVLIGGGYGTGRELVEFFLSYGPLGGLMGMLLVSTVMWSLLLAVTFEFSRKFRAYDYRTFFKNLLGPFWFVFEMIYFLYMLIVLAGVGSAAGILLRDNFGIPYIFGVILMLTAVGFLTFKGSGLIENFLSVWSMILYAVYAAFLIVGVMKFGPEIQKNFAEEVGDTDPEFHQLYSEATKVVVSTELKGSKIKESKYKEEGGKYQAVVLVEYSLKDAKEALVNEIKKEQNLYTRFRASEGFKDLEKEVEKYEQYKKEQQ